MKDAYEETDSFVAVFLLVAGCDMMDRLPAKLPFSKQRLRPRIIISYIFDYVILVFVVP